MSNEYQTMRSRLSREPRHRVAELRSSRLGKLLVPFDDAQGMLRDALPAPQHERFPSSAARLFPFTLRRPGSHSLLIAHCSLLLGLACVPLSTLAQKATPVTGEPVRVTSRIEPEQTTIGPPVRYTMTVEAEDGVELIVPILSERLGDFLIIDFGEAPAEQKGGRTVVEQFRKNNLL